MSQRNRAQVVTGRNAATFHTAAGGASAGGTARGTAVRGLGELEAAAARWVSRAVGAIDHERRVRAIATALFDLTRDRLGLRRGDLALLRMAALVHDVGRGVNDKDHPAEGAKLLLGTTALPLADDARRALAFLTLYHRGDVPPPGREAVLKRSDSRDTLRPLLGLLRVADALDSRHVASPRLVFTRRGGKLSVRCFVAEADWRDARQVYRRRKKFHLLETHLGREITVDVRVGAPAPDAAPDA